jgi:hypothetical protein
MHHIIRLNAITAVCRVEGSEQASMSSHTGSTEYRGFIEALRKAGYAGITHTAATAGLAPAVATEVVRRAIEAGHCTTANHGALLVYAEVRQVPGLLDLWIKRTNDI